MIEKNLLRSVTDAVLELCCADVLLKDRLLSAVRALNTVLVRREDWPVPLRRRAQEIADELNSRGAPEQVIAAMDFQSARRLAERILHLYADCQIAANRDQP
jgi:hypothetical protein